MREAPDEQDKVQKKLVNADDEPKSERPRRMNRLEAEATIFGKRQIIDRPIERAWELHHKWNHHTQRPLTTKIANNNMLFTLSHKRLTSYGYLETS